MSITTTPRGKTTGTARRSAVLLASAMLGLGAIACDVEKTREGELPKVDIQGGQMPAYDVKPATVQIGTTVTEVRVPTVDVTMPSEQTPVPTP